MTRNELSLFAAGLVVAWMTGCGARSFHNQAPTDFLAGAETARFSTAGRVSPYHSLPATMLVDSPTSPHRAVVQRGSAEPSESELIPAPTPTANGFEPASASNSGSPRIIATGTTAKAPETARKPEEPLVEALRCLVDKRPEEALALLRQYDQLNQDMLLSLLALSVRLTQGSLDQANSQEVAHVLEQLNSLSATLRSRAALSVEKMCFCRTITRFGAYDPLPQEHQFQAGKEDKPGERVLLYVELQNFASLSRGSHYETELATRLELRDLRDNRVWVKDFPAEQPDRSHTLRHDYFIAYRFWVPAQIPPGLYTLWVEVRDITGNRGKEVPPHRIARRSLQFRVAPSQGHTTARPGS